MTYEVKKKLMFKYLKDNYLHDHDISHMLYNAKGEEGQKLLDCFLYGLLYETDSEELAKGLAFVLFKSFYGKMHKEQEEKHKIKELLEPLMKPNESFYDEEYISNTQVFDALLLEHYLPKTRKIVKGFNKYCKEYEEKENE